MNGAQWAGLIAALMVAANLLCLAVAFVRLRRKQAPSRLQKLAPPVTIVRPVCGIETFSRETLTSGLELDYPQYETIFCVADGHDPIVPLIEELIATYGADRVRLIVGDVAVSANPKLNNCVKGWEAARHDWVILADSNVLMPKDYVQRLMASWREDTGLVCSTPAGSRPGCFGAEVECAFLNTFQARWQYAGEALGFGFAQGKSMLWNKPFLDANGGIAALAAEIAEDAAATKLVRKAGKHVHLVGQPSNSRSGRVACATSSSASSAGRACAASLSCLSSRPKSWSGRWCRPCSRPSARRPSAFPPGSACSPCWRSGMPARSCWPGASAGSSTGGRRSPIWRAISLSPASGPMPSSRAKSAGAAMP